MDEDRSDTLGTVLGAVLIMIMMAVVTLTGPCSRDGGKDKRVFQKIRTSDTYVEVSRPKEGRPEIGPRLSRED